MNKIKKISVIVFVSLFFAFCAFFSLGMLIEGASDAAEGNRTAPVLIENGKINEGFGDEFEEWFSKKFAFRSKIVSFFSYIKAEVFGTGNDQVTVGNDGFLFFNDTIDSYTGLNPLSDEEIRSAAVSVSNIKDYTEEHGAEFLFVPVPNKATVYYDMMPKRYIKNEGLTDFDRLLSELDALGVEYVDLRETLINKKSDGLIYHKRDTHWTSLGAYTALLKIGEALDFEVPELKITGIREDFTGDLDSLLYPDEEKYDTDYIYDTEGRFVFTSAYSNEMNMSISTRGEGNGKLLIFRDSFANALIPLMSSAFAEVKYERPNPYRADLLESFDADYVIVLIAERNIKDLIGSDSRITD